MSHVTKVKTQLKDGQVLRMALKKLCYRIEEKGAGSHSTHFGREENLDLVARKGGQQIGFKRSGSGDGCYEMLADWSSLKGRREDLINSILQVYSQEKILQIARLKGYAITKNRTTQDGKIEIVLRKVA